MATEVAASEATLGEVERFLEEVIGDLKPAARSNRVGRPAVLPALCLWAGLVVGVARGFTSQASIWRLLSQFGLWAYPRVAISDEAVYRRLARATTDPLERLFAQISAIVRERVAPYQTRALASFATEVVAIDETTLDPVARRLPSLRGVSAADSTRLPGKLAGVFDVRAQCWRTIQHHRNPHQNEKLEARALVEALPSGTLILADLGYFGFAWFDWLTEHGYWWVSRLRAKTSYRVEHVLYQRGEVLDALVWLGAYRADRAKAMVRLVQYRQGGVTHQYLTNVLEPSQLSLADIARLYARRWDIEMAFKLIKRELHLHLLWSSRVETVLLQVWAVLIIAQIVQAIRMEVAGRAGVDPFEVSLPLLVAYLPQIAAGGRDPIEFVVETGAQFGFIRPSRRLRLDVPEIPPEWVTPAPPGLVTTRPARYAGRRGAGTPMMIA